MADHLTPEKRSWNMSRVRSVDTKPERKVRSLLHTMGLRFRINSKKLPGKPDIVLRKYKTVIFVHGCFWHSHKSCNKSKLPATRVQFWKEKIRSNVKRDKRSIKELKKLGWNTIVIWECELNMLELSNKIKDLLRKQNGKEQNQI